MTAKPQGDPELTLLPPSSSRWRSELALAGLIGLLGAVMGLTWVALGPRVQGWSDQGESALAGDVSFTVLASLAAVLTLAWLWLRRPPLSASRFLVALFASAAASALAFEIGGALKAPPTTSWGILIVWPMILALGTALVSLALSFSASANE